MEPIKLIIRLFSLLALLLPLSLSASQAVIVKGQVVETDTWWMATHPKFECKPAGITMVEYTSYLDSQKIEYQFSAPESERAGYYTMFQKKKDEELGGIAIWARSLEKCALGAELPRVNLATLKVRESLGEKYEKLTNRQRIEALRKQYNELWETKLTTSEYLKLFNHTAASFKKMRQPSNSQSSAPTGSN